MKKDEESWGWAVVIAAFFIGFLTDGLQYSYGLLFIEFLDEFKETKATTSWIGGLFFGWYTLGPLASMLTNKFGCRVAVVTGGVICFIGVFSSAFSTSIPFLYVSFGCFGGLGFLLLNVPKELAVIQYFEKKRSFAMGIAVCGSGFGTIVFNPLTKWLIDEYGWRGTLQIESGLLLNCVACGLVMRPFVETPESTENTYTRSIRNSTERVSLVLVEHAEKDTAVDGESSPHVELLEKRKRSIDSISVGIKTPTSCHASSNGIAAIIENSHSSHSIKKNENKLLNIRLLKEPKVIIFLLVCLFEGLAYYTPFTFLPDLVVFMGKSRGQAAMLLTTIGIVNTVLRIPIGLIGDLRWISRTFVVSASYVFLGLAVWAMPYLQHYKMMVGICVFFGTFVAVYVVFTPVVVADLFGDDDIVDLFGYAFFIFGIGAFISGPLAGLQFDATGDYNLSFLTAGGSFVLAGVLSFILYFLHRKEVRMKKAVSEIDLELSD